MVPDHIDTFEKHPAIIGLQHYHMDIKWPILRSIMYLRVRLER